MAEKPQLHEETYDFYDINEVADYLDEKFQTEDTVTGEVFKDWVRDQFVNWDWLAGVLLIPIAEAAENPQKFGIYDDEEDDPFVVALNHLANELGDDGGFMWVRYDTF